MRDSQRLHPALLVSSNRKWAYAPMADMPIVGILEGMELNIVYSTSHLANAQCEAVRGRIPLYCGLQARSYGMRP